MIDRIVGSVYNIEAAKAKMHFKAQLLVDAHPDWRGSGFLGYLRLYRVVA